MRTFLKFFFTFFCLFTVLKSFIFPVFADDFHRAVVKEVLSETRFPGENNQTFYSQDLQLERLDTHEQIKITVGSEVEPLSASQKFTAGMVVIVSKQQVTEGQSQYVTVDKYRLPGMAWLALGFFGLVILVARRQGLFAIVGMFLSLFVLMSFTIPQIIAGQNPVLISLLGSGAVAVITIYLCHGFQMESHVALVSIFLVLIAVGLLSFSSVQAIHLAGLGSEEAAYLQFGSTTKVNLQGLLLAGILLGALGVLTDITLAQVFVVSELHDAKRDMHFAELYSRSLTVGKNHVASLVNTLVLAYAASSLPLFLLFTTNVQQPSWVTFNSEVIAEEVVRTLTGSIGLVLAVPLTTLVATYFALTRKTKRKDSSQVHAHSHAH